MKHSLTSFTAAAILFAASARAAEPEAPAFRIRPIEHTAAAELPEDLPQELFLGGGGDAGVAKIKYLVEGAAIVGIDKLSITSIKLPDGTELVKPTDNEQPKRTTILGRLLNGSPPPKDEPLWSLGSFPRASHDGDYATFELEIRKPLIGKIESTKITGTATMLLGYDRKDQSVEIVPKEKKSVDVGPFKITVDPVKPDAGPKPGAAPQPAAAPQAAAAPFLPGLPADGPTVDLTIAGPLKGLDGFEMLDGTEQLNSWYTNEENKRTYNLPVPKTGKYTIKLGFWNTVKKATAPLGP